MFAALHGELTLHPWRDPVTAESDAYSLFYARSSAMGWLADASESHLGGTWGMNDAEQDPVSGSQPSRRIWFQVVLIDPIPVGRPLPVQAFLACAGDVVARIGTLRLQAVKVLLPVERLNTSAGASSHLNAVGNLIQDSGWFADCNPHLSTQVRVTLDSGQDSSIRSVAPAMFQWMQQFRQKVFACDSFSLKDDDAVVLQPAITEALWLGPGQHRATFHGTLIEWSLDALGWLAAFLSTASSKHGVSTPLMLTVSRSEGSVSRAQ
jgi:hypothetical protein